MTSTEPKTIQEWRDLKPELETKQTQLAYHAEHLIANTRERDWMGAMRDMAIELDIHDVVKDNDLQNYLEAAERRSDQGRVYRGGEKLLQDEPTFLLDGLVHHSQTNLLVGQPKIGKSSFACGLIAAIRDRRENFLGRSLDLPVVNMPVLIFGTDQSEGNWQYYLRREGLLDDEKRLHSCIDLFVSVDTKDEFNFTKDGIRHMKEEIEKHEKPLVVIDSLSSMMEPCRLKENLSDFSRPIRDASKKLTTTGATLLILHHTKKDVSSWDWVSECRGSGNISSIPSWGVLMRWVKEEDDGLVRIDRRVGFVGSGRGHSELGGVQAQYLSDGNWQTMGSLEKAQQIERVRKKISSLGGVRGEVFDYLRMRTELDADVCADEISSTLSPPKTASNISREFANLAGLGLAYETRYEPTGGRPKTYWKVTDSAIAAMSSALRDSHDDSSDSFDSNYLKINKINKINLQGEESQNLKSSFKINDVVEINKGAAGWQNGYIVFDNTDPDSLVVAKKFDVNHRVKNLRPGLDIRHCESAFPIPATFDEIDF